jgi:uncharacterized phage protein (TIGR02218 family)
MTDHTDNLAAAQQKSVPEFYLFTTGSTVERWTSFSRNLTFLGQEWTAASITRGGVKYDQGYSEVRLNITTPITPSLATYIPNQPIEPVRVTIYRSHIDYLAQYSIFFKGQIKHVQFSDNLASAQCVASDKYLNMKLPNFIYQSYCNHDIYDDRCAVDSLSYRRTIQIATITSSTVTFTIADGGSPMSIGYLNGGKMNFGTDVRFITGHPSADEIDLHVPFDSRLEVGDEAYVYPGCDGSPTTCINTYGNLANFCGMPYIPSQNPVVWGFK